MHANIDQKLVFSVTLMLVTSLLAYGYYLEFVEGLAPCPLCSIQRLCYFLIALTSLTAIIHKPGDFGHAVYVYASGLLASIGSVVAGRQVWLQHLPSGKLPECGPDLAYLLEVYGLAESLGAAIRGTGDCATVKWEFLTLSIAEWSLLWFLVLTSLCVIDRMRSSKKKDTTPSLKVSS